MESSSQHINEVVSEELAAVDLASSVLRAVVSSVFAIFSLIENSSKSSIGKSLVDISKLVFKFFNLCRLAFLVCLMVSLINVVFILE